MRIAIHNRKREPVATVEVDPKKPPTVIKPAGGESGAELYLQWDQAVDDRGHLRHCPVCGCRELFVRKDFPQSVGLLIIVLAVAASLALFAMRRLALAVGVLAAVFLADRCLSFFTGRCLVCYRCRSEFRDLPIRRDHPNWDLSTGEKYRADADGSAGNEPAAVAGEDRAP